MMKCWLLVIPYSVVYIHAAPFRLPEASSSILYTHRLYVQQSPHDFTLYDQLQVSPNATSHEITKSYRRLTRQLHPDKIRSNDDGEKLERVRQAYEILKDDNTRLPYHRYGLKDASEAVNILSGNVMNTDTKYLGLFRLMGFPPDGSRSLERHQRVVYLAKQIFERIRPLIEQSVDKVTMITMLVEELDQLKRLPLGSHIIRCVGRAYRYSGRKMTREQKVGVIPLPKASLELTNSVRAKLRTAKHILTAAVASGHVLLADRRVSQAKSIHESLSSSNSITYFDGVDNLSSTGADNDDDVTFDAPTDDEIKAAETLKSRSAVAGAVQVEALWKVSKVELDRIVREACGLILSEQWLAMMNRKPPRNDAEYERSSGWVGSRGKAVDWNMEGRFRAAEALELVGDIFVQRSKEGTSWME